MRPGQYGRPPGRRLPGRVAVADGPASIACSRRPIRTQQARRRGTAACPAGSRAIRAPATTGADGARSRTQDARRVHAYNPRSRAAAHRQRLGSPSEQSAPPPSPPPVAGPPLSRCPPAVVIARPKRSDPDVLGDRALRHPDPVALDGGRKVSYVAKRAALLGPLHAFRSAVPLPHSPCLARTIIRRPAEALRPGRLVGAPWRDAVLDRSRSGPVTLGCVLRRHVPCLGTHQVGPP